MFEILKSLKMLNTISNSKIPQKCSKMFRIIKSLKRIKQSSKYTKGKSSFNTIQIICLKQKQNLVNNSIHSYYALHEKYQICWVIFFVDNMAICEASLLWWKCSFAFNGDTGNFPDIFRGTHLNFVSQTHIIQLCHLRILCFRRKNFLRRIRQWWCTSSVPICLSHNEIRGASGKFFN